MNELKKEFLSLNELELLKLKVKDYWIYSLKKIDFENILENEKEFDETIIPMVKEVLDNWEHHSVNIERVSKMMTWNVSAILEELKK